MTKRFEDIDFLRGFAILIIIITHVYGLHLSNTRDFTIWNWLHFVVPGFLFCSGFVLASQTKKFTSVSNISHWIGKRLARLLLPFYAYFIVHFSLFLIFPGIFSNFHFKNTFDFVFGSIFFTGGGVSLSWLPILFVQLTLFFPILYYLKKKNLLFIFKSLILAGIALITVTNQTIPLQNLTHWLFWLYPFTLGYLLSDLKESDRKNMYILASILSLGVFVFLFILFSQTSQSLVLTHHKYPPDLFYLSYSFGLEFLILAASPFFLRLGLLKAIILFFSKNSYKSFFIHYVLLDFVFSFTKNQTIVGSAIIQSTVVILLTAATVLIWDKIQPRLIALRLRLSYK